MGFMTGRDDLGNGLKVAAAVIAVACLGLGLGMGLLLAWVS